MIEIGSNDGSFIKNFSKKKVIGIEPCSNVEKITKKKEQNFEAITGKFSITNSKNIEQILNPELRIYNQPNIVTSEADIKTTLMKDKFIVINLVQNQEYFNVRYQDKPFMLWIWVSVLLLSMGGILSFFKKSD